MEGSARTIRVMITSTQSDSGKILLAYNAEGCPSQCQNLRHVLKV